PRAPRSLTAVREPTTPGKRMSYNFPPPHSSSPVRDHAKETPMYVHALRTLAFSGLIALGLAARPATPPNLGGPNRALTSISSDKPIYRGGERVYVRGVVLDAFQHTPVVQWTQATVEIRGPKGH